MLAQRRTYPRRWRDLERCGDVRGNDVPEASAELGSDTGNAARLCPGGLGDPSRIRRGSSKVVARQPDGDSGGSRYRPGPAAER